MKFSFFLVFIWGAIACNVGSKCGCLSGEAINSVGQCTVVTVISTQYVTTALSFDSGTIINVTGPVTVTVVGSVIINAGVVLLFTKPTSGFVINNGRLTISGSASFPVSLIGQGIARSAISGTGVSTIAFARFSGFIEYALTGYEFFVSNSTFFDSEAAAILSGGASFFKNCSFTHHWLRSTLAAVTYRSGHYKLTDCYFSSQLRAIGSVQDGSALLLRAVVTNHTSTDWAVNGDVQQSVISDNTGTGIVGTCSQSTVSRNLGGGVSGQWIQSCTITENRKFGIWVDGGCTSLSDNIITGTWGSPGVGAYLKSGYFCYASTDGNSGLVLSNSIVANSSAVGVQSLQAAVSGSVIVGNPIGVHFIPDYGSNTVLNSWVCGSQTLVIKNSHTSSAKVSGVWFGMNMTRLNVTCADTFLRTIIRDVYQDGSVGVVTLSGMLSIPPSTPEISSPYRGLCTICPRGQGFSTDLCRCAKCPEGSFPHSGYYSESTLNVGAVDSSGCAKCLAGNFLDVGTLTCLTCLAGTFSSSAGAASCSTCPSGTYSGPGATTCMSCPTGTTTIGSSTGSTAVSDCTMCAPGYAGLLVNSGTLSASGCSICPVDQYSFGGAACSTCPSGSIIISSSLGCQLLSSSSSAGPFDNAFYFSGSQSEGVTAFSHITTPSGITYVSNAFGVSSTAISLSGSSYLSVPGSSLPSVLPSRGNVAWSISAWIKCPSPNTWASVVEWGEVGNSRTSFRRTSALIVGGAGVIKFGSITGFYYPKGIAVDSIGNIYAADIFFNEVRKVSVSGFVSTIATGLNNPRGVAVDSVGNVYVADTNNNAVKKITPNGIITIFFNGISGPQDIAVDSVGNVYVVDLINGLIKKVTPSGIVSTLSNELTAPSAIAVDLAGNVYVADYYGVSLKKIEPSGKISMLSHGLYFALTGIAVDSADDVYVADNASIKKISPSGMVTTIVDSGLSYPSKIALDSFGNIFVTCQYENDIKIYTPNIPACDSTWHHVSLSYTPSTLSLSSCGFS
jgi:streptogramin lyase